MSAYSFYIQIAISLIYTVLLGTSAFEKCKSLTVPDWFIKQFANSFLGKFSSLTKISYWVITLAEVTLAGLFLSSLVFPFLLPIALIGSLFLFTILCFGLRISYDFQGSANMFTYFAATLIALFGLR